jgi:hypothetical protein
VKAVNDSEGKRAISGNLVDFSKSMAFDLALKHKREGIVCKMDN